LKLVAVAGGVVGAAAAPMPVRAAGAHVAAADAQALMDTAGGVLGGGEARRLRFETAQKHVNDETQGSYGEFPLTGLLAILQHPAVNDVLVAAEHGWGTNSEGSVDDSEKISRAAAFHPVDDCEGSYLFRFPNPDTTFTGPFVTVSCALLVTFTSTTDTVTNPTYITSALFAYTTHPYIAQQIDWRFLFFISGDECDVEATHNAFQPSFVDIGSGAGRLILAASTMRAWRSVTGIEASEPLATLGSDAIAALEDKHVVQKGLLKSIHADANLGSGSVECLFDASCVGDPTGVGDGGQIAHAASALAGADIALAYSTAFPSPDGLRLPELSAALSAVMRPGAVCITCGACFGLSQIHPDTVYGPSLSVCTYGVLWSIDTVRR
jgi:hypothetical protein